MFAKFSPDGKKVAYVSKHNIYIEDLTNNQLNKITSDGTDRMINGLSTGLMKKNSVRMVSDGLRTEVKLLIGSWMLMAPKIF
jgi:hypothetical protein